MKVTAKRRVRLQLHEYGLKKMYRSVPGQKLVDVTPIRDNHSRPGAGNEQCENQQERRNGAVDLLSRSCFGGEATCTGSDVFS